MKNNSIEQESFNPKKVECVKTLLNQSLNFKVEVSLKELNEILKSFKPYNEIPEQMVNIVHKFIQKIPSAYYNENNPNNGSYCHVRCFIGNESSLVIYFDVQVQPTKLSKEEVKSNLQRLGNNFNADEITFKERKGYYTFIEARLWWD